MVSVVWKTFGCAVVVEKVAGTELKSSLVCLVLGMKERILYLQNNAQMERCSGELKKSNRLLITC